MISRSQKASYAKQVFFRNFNDVDIFIEDTAAESKKIYTSIFQRVFGTTVRISQIFPIGSKNQVLERCTNDQGERARRAVYIVDGDHDYICANELPPLKRLYRLKRYCIENYFIDEDAIVEVLDDDILDLDKEGVRRHLDWTGWLARISDALQEVLIACAIAKIKKCQLRVTNIPLSKICSCETGKINSGMSAAFCDEYRAAVEGKFGSNAFDEARIDVLKRLSGDTKKNVISYVSAKAIILPLLKRRLRHKFKFSTSDVLFRMRLAKKCDISELHDLPDHVC